MKHVTPNRGFTLIELLVVISIIALLVAVLLPALSKAKEASKRLKCITGVRQANLAVEYYLNDWEEFYPANNPGAYSGITSRNYAGVLVDREYTSEDNFDNRGGCPDSEPPSYNLLYWWGNDYYSAVNNEGTYLQSISYGLNPFLQNAWGPTFPYVPPYYQYHGRQRRTAKRVEHDPSNMVTMACNVTPWGSSSPNPFVSLYHTLGLYTAYIPVNRLNARHEGVGLPMAMSDGHAELVLQEQVRWVVSPAYWQPESTPMASFSQYNYYAGVFGWDSN